MKVVWKFPLKITDEVQTISLPRNYWTGHVGAQGSQLCLWIQVDPSLEREDIKFRVFGTGQAIPDNYYHVGTVQMEPFVWHLYEEGK